MTLAAYLGDELRRRRVLRQLRQEDIATTARAWGLRWARSDVAALEAGRRSLALEEVFLLPWIAANEGPDAVKRGQDHPVELTDLFPGRGSWITWTRRFLVSDVALRAILRGEAGGGGLHEGMLNAPSSGLHGGDLQRMALAWMAENAAVLDHLRLRDRPDASQLLEAAHADKLGDAEQKAARRLRTFPLAVAAAARKRWGRSLTEERDRRVSEHAPADATPRTLQALRGHVSRDLLDELREEGIEGLRVKRAGTIRHKRRGKP
jgi:hypothetical protein